MYFSLSREGAGRLRLATLLVLAYLYVFPPAAHAAGTTPIIHWDASMSYPGENGGHPWGPVGENTLVYGEGFTANQLLRFFLVPGDTNSDATLCKPTGVNLGMVETDAAGTFRQNFLWPAAAGTINQIYSICTLSLTGTTVVSHLDDGPFTVLAAAPTIAISSTTITAGQTLTVTGQNWVPPQPVIITIAGCAACNVSSSEVTSYTINSTGANTGTFSAQILIPPSARAGKYVVDAITQNGVLEAYFTSGTKDISINALPVTVTPVVTVTVAPPTLTPARSTQSDQGIGGITIALYVAIALVVGAILFLLILIFKPMGTKEKLALIETVTSQPVPPVENISGDIEGPTQPVPASSALPNPPGNHGQFSNPVSSAGFGPPLFSQSLRHQGMLSNPPSYHGLLSQDSADVGQIPLKRPVSYQGFGQPLLSDTSLAACPHCGVFLSPGTTVCKRCGAPLNVELPDVPPGVG